MTWLLAEQLLGTTPICKAATIRNPHVFTIPPDAADAGQMKDLAGWSVVTYQKA
jgi:hypothetical protein